MSRGSDNIYNKGDESSSGGGGGLGDPTTNAEDGTASHTMSPWTQCPLCGKMVPSGNMLIHSLTACSGADGGPTNNSSSNNNNSNNVSSNAATGYSRMDIDAEGLSPPPSSSSSSSAFEEDEIVSMPQKSRRKRPRRHQAANTSSVDTAADLMAPSPPSHGNQPPSSTTHCPSSSFCSTSDGYREEIAIDDDDDENDDDDDVVEEEEGGGGEQGQGHNSDNFDIDTKISISNDGNDIEVVDLVDSPPRQRHTIGLAAASPYAAATTTTSATPDLTGDGSKEGDDANNNEDGAANPNEWACPKCTLLNPSSSSYCDACNYCNPNYVRPPDTSRSERLIGAGDESPISLAASGALGGLFGGIISVAGNYVHGRNLTSGLVDGAMTGAIGGALLHNVAQSATQEQSRRRRQQIPMMTVTHSSNSTTTLGGHHGSFANARSSSAMGMAGYPSTNTQGARSRQQPRNSYRSVQTVNADGSVTITTTGGGRSTRSTSRMSGHFNDPMVQFLLHQQLIESAGLGDGRGTIRFGVAAGPRALGGGFAPFMGSMEAGGANIDGMTYEQLLERFGDGSENRGADDSTIRRLPVKKLENPKDELPEDARQCMICLEDFEKGALRMILPCLHGFHSQCCTKWLRQNGSCPICKHNINMSGA